MIGTAISHYKITRQLGMGGMGVVYAAEDPRLQRQVALKFVPEDLAHDQRALERLRSEARTASSLNHPNICTIYDIGEHQGRPFIVMELLAGITLRERMSGRPMKLHEVVDIGMQVADALYWAHNKDIIHRDIKPANLFLVDQGQVKVLDFGLAKQVISGPSDATVAPTIDLTGIGVTLGTVAYMSPEQVSGETLDRRTDLFSLGIVLYECVTGQLPFTGKTSAVVLASILTQAPPAPVALNPELPPGLQDVINKCLEKDRELRYQDAAGLRADLKRIKRDIESGQLKAMSAAAARASGPVDIPLSGATASTPVGASSAPMSAVRTDTTVVQAVPPHAVIGKGLMIGLGAGAVAAAGLVFLLMSGRQNAPEPHAANVENTPAAAPAEPVGTPPAHAPSTPAAVPADNSRARFDEAILDANRLLAAGDTDGATRALNTARAIDPSAPAVAELSSRLVEQFRSVADARRPTSEPPRPQAAARPAPPAEPVAPARPGAQAARGTPPAQGNTPPPAAAAPPPAVVAQAPEPAPQAVPPPVAVAPAPPPRTAPEPAPPVRTDPPVERRPPATPVEDDDATIRRIVATYARAIEQKDIALFRSVKPNLTPDEQRRIEDGFRAVTSQKVDVTILSIDRRAADASVRLRRRDTIQAGGRQQVTDTQQTIALTKAAAGWVIREIGR